MDDTTRHLTVVADDLDGAGTRCADHPAYEADYCPLCGTAVELGRNGGHL